MNSEGKDLFKKKRNYKAANKISILKKEKGLGSVRLGSATQEDFFFVVVVDGNCLVND